MKMRIHVSIALLIMLVSCSPSETPPKEQAPTNISAGSSAAHQVLMPLPDYFDCLRESGGTVIAAHRGGPAPGYPENALETMQYNFEHGVGVFEIDVTETRDGMLTLMHDRKLGRTTNGRGFVSETDWARMSTLKLVDNQGKRTRFSPPILADVLVWARTHGAILELDLKEKSGLAKIADAVHAADAVGNVIFISYSDQEAAHIASLDPDFMMTASARGGRDIKRLEALGVDRRHLIAWTGTTRPDEAAWDRNARNKVESAFGTLGPPGDRLDDTYLADGNGSEFQDLADMGLVILATDRPVEAAAAMTADDIARNACMH